MRFFEGRIDDHELGLRRLFIARSGNGLGRIEGTSVVCNPMDNGSRWSTEIYRHRTDSVRGTVAFLFHHLMQQLAGRRGRAGQPVPRSGAIVFDSHSGRQLADPLRLADEREVPQRAVRLCGSQAFQEPISTAFREPLRVCVTARFVRPLLVVPDGSRQLSGQCSIAPASLRRANSEAGHAEDDGGG